MLQTASGAHSVGIVLSSLSYLFSLLKLSMKGTQQHLTGSLASPREPRRDPH